MSSLHEFNTVEEDELSKFEIIDHNIAAGYVTYIVDLWEGDRHDPAVGIERYIGVWHGEDLVRGEDEEAFDPDFTHKKNSYSYNRAPTPEPLVWKSVERVKKAERDAEMYKDQQENLMNTEYMGYGQARSRKELYQAFMLAIDILVTDPDNEAAWEAVDSYRNYQAGLHEK